MTLIIDDVDYSAYIQQKNGIKESPREINGANARTSIDGFDIYDVVAYKLDPSFLLKPMPAEMMRTFITAINKAPVRIQYSSFMHNTVRTIEAKAVASSINYLTEANGKRIYGEASVSFRER